MIVLQKNARLDNLSELRIKKRFYAVFLSFYKCGLGEKCEFVFVLGKLAFSLLLAVVAVLRLKKELGFDIFLTKIGENI